MEREIQRMINDQKASIHQIPKKRPVEIRCTRIEYGIILVNGKEVRKDMDGRWITKECLNEIEVMFFGAFLSTLESCGNKKPHQAIYTV